MAREGSGFTIVGVAMGHLDIQNVTLLLSQTVTSLSKWTHWMGTPSCKHFLSRNSHAIFGYCNGGVSAISSAGLLLVLMEIRKSKGVRNDYLIWSGVIILNSDFCADTIE